jgi:hypothetical protein
VWRRPTASATVAYDDLGGRFRLEWKGEPDAAYRLQYQAGEGLLSVAGEMEVIGTAKDFGIIDRYYWNTWLVPYGTFRLRVGVTGRDDLWTDWITLRAVRAPAAADAPRLAQNGVDAAGKFHQLDLVGKGSPCALQRDQFGPAIAPSTSLSSDTKRRGGE